MRPLARRLLLATLLLGSGLAGARTLDAIRASGELRICVAGSSAPFYQANAESFARFLDVRPAVTRLADWDQQFHDAGGTTVKAARYEAARLADGRCDLYPNDLHIVDWRQSKMLLVPYYSTRKVVVAHRDLRQLLKTPDDLAGRSAAVQKDTAYDAWLREQNEQRFAAKPIAIVHAPTAESMRRVAAREADFTVAGGEAVFKWVRGDLDNLDILFPVDAPVEVGWGVSPRAPDLAAALERFFDASTRVGSELDRAWQRAYGISLMEYKLHEAAYNTSGFDRRRLLAWGLPIGGIVLGVLAAMGFWTRRLRRIIAEHQRTEAHLQLTQASVAREARRRAALAAIAARLQRTTTPAELARTLLAALAQYLPLGQGMLCVRDDAAGELRALAHFAGPGADSDAVPAELQAAGSLLDVCVDSRRLILVERPGDQYLRIRSSLCAIDPAELLILPIVHGDRLAAILELATLAPLDVEQRLLLDELAPTLALSLDLLLQAERTRQLLAQAEAALAEAARSRNLIQAVLDNSPTDIYIKDLEGRFMLVNQRFAGYLRAVFDIDAARLIGHTIAEFIGAERDRWGRESDARVIAANRLMEFEHEIEWPAGTEKRHVYKFPIHDADGRLYAVGVIAQDIDARRADDDGVD